ncbi:MAG: amidohydrolase [Steroidobacteraceae bacterium]|nr:amidohydrolase [Steroidobacteraceae bacterium]
MNPVPVAALLLLAVAPLMAAPPSVDTRLAAVESKVVAWRRDIHQHPELGNREFRTAALVAAHLESLGLEVRTGIAKTGVIGVLHGARPGKVLALRADMDALPVAEQTGLPFASRVVADYEGREVPVMHACGHDAHTAILMGAAEVLAGLRGEIAGTILFVFQPAEEGPPAGEEGGAKLMLAEGALDAPRPDAIFALHVEPGPPGRIDARPGPFLSSATTLRIRLEGRQTHGGRPWEGTDLVNLAADIVKSLTTISARQVNVFEFPNVVTIASVQAGVRMNILPSEATLGGTIRTFSAERLALLKDLIRTSVEGLAKSYGASAAVEFEEAALVTGNDPALLQQVLPALEQAAGPAGVNTVALLRGAAEDFSYFETQIPGLYYILGSTKNFTSMDAAPTNHSPRFDIDESVLAVGVKAQVLTALRYLRADRDAR